VVVTQASELCNQKIDSLQTNCPEVDIVAISRAGKTLSLANMPNLTYLPGDLLLVQGELHALTQATRLLNLIALDTPHQARNLRKKIAPLLIFSAAIIASSLRLIPTSMSFTLVVMLFIVFKLITLRKAYESIDWSVIILLSALIPVGAALETTGGSALLAKLLLTQATHYPAYYSVGILLLVTMTLSDCINNAATTILMAPIAITIANALHTSLDPFLMAVALGASCSFLTPVGHQNNILVMGPGGYRFQDYIRIGLPLELLVIAVGLPLILFCFPL
jgi:di/tricarboxylate transporter